MAMEVDRKAGSVTAKVAPNQSLYIQNLQIKRLKKADLQHELYLLFSTYGSVLAVTTVKSDKMRGQAHVLYKDIETAARAMQLCQGQEFHGRKIRISYSKNHSKVLSNFTGTVVPAKSEPTTSTANGASTAGVAPTGKSISVIPPPPSLSAQPPRGASPASTVAGRKRSREVSDDEMEQKTAPGKAAEDEEDDDDAMEMSESDDD